MTAKRYYGQDINVLFDLSRCLHVGVCVQSLPDVFDTQRRPWVLPDAGVAQQIAQIVARCPTGALTYEFTDPELGQEQGRVPTSIRTADNQPIWVHGQLELFHNDTKVELTRAALCDCGSSTNQPYCDASGPCTGWRGQHGGQPGEQHGGQPTK
jgi:uncharacterized Fe-S cluster protein YjdI/CDGSH-type Zn-finger protein